MTPGPLALSLGDPAGVGPEIALKAWAALRRTGPAFFVIGDADVLAEAPCAGPAPIRRIDRAARAVGTFAEALPVLHMPLAGPVAAGHPAPAAADAIIDWIERGARLALAGEAAALVTGPIAKASLYAGGFAFPGHTELLGVIAPAPVDATARGPVMMLATEGLRVSLVTIHMALARVAPGLTIEAVINAGLVTALALSRDFGVVAPRLAVAGLNPHAGEAGALGTEEGSIIAPAVARLRELGVEATGPHPADTLFHPEARATYDAVLCMYHDQGLIPVKMLDFWGGVNVTLGLPIVRTSPDHGTGFDIAGKGVARPDSLIAALRLAARIAENRARA
ncbi:MAG: 4-hydroxythreonine-4-phosphate dehydrogenase PdxA [Caulobacteraceae bacterium]